MGILNVTPDSFSDGGVFVSHDDAHAHALAMIQAGAQIIDIGGESTRPGAVAVDADEEMRRVIPVIESLAECTDAVISVDTSKAVVAHAAVQAGAHLINDVSALLHDPAMIDVVVESGASLVLMHMQGTPRTMQANPHYDDVVKEVLQFLLRQAYRLQQRGVDKDRIWLDPGIGFGKTVEHNLTLIASLKEFSRTGYPVLLGTSRKSFIGKLTGAEVTDRLPGTLATLGKAASAGVRAVRVHDVAEARQFLSLWKAISEHHEPDSIRR